MTDVAITHSKVSAKADGPDTTLVLPSDWNADHVLTMAGPGLVGRSTAGPGPAELLDATDYQLLSGTGAIWFGPTVPTGWYFCNGELKDRIIDADLFAVIGTTYNIGSGGEDSSNFRLPNLCGNLPAGVDNMGGVTPAGRITTPQISANNTLGATGGEQTHTLTAAEQASMPVTGTTEAAARFSASGPTVFNGPGVGGDIPVFNGALDLTGTATGGGGPHDNLPPVLMVNFIIKR